MWPWHRHTWSKWEPILLKGVFRNGTRYTEDMQERCCAVCGRTQRTNFY